MRRSLLICGLVAIVAISCIAAVAAKQHHNGASEIHPHNGASEIAHHKMPHQPHHGADNWAIQFTHFKQTHKKKYHSKKEEAKRFAIFIENMKIAREQQAASPLAKFGMTRFSDLTKEEFKKHYLSAKPAQSLGHKVKNVASKKKLSRKVQALPTNFDWRTPDKNRPVALTAVKDQGQCGSCWAFSATEEVESMWILSGKPSVALAPQQLVDCNENQYDQGCSGGETEAAFAYIEQYGLETEAAYPYVSGYTQTNGTCAYNPSSVVAHMTSYEWATPECNPNGTTCATQDEQTLAENIYNVGPAAIYVDASQWQNYMGGIYTASAGCANNFSALDHGVQLVGFGYDEGLQQKYWTVRNSWNAGWGESGFIRLLFGENTCGLADHALIVKIN